MNKFLAILALIALPVISNASAVKFGRIVDIKGSGFISYNGKTHEIKKGEEIYADSELIIEHSGQVTFTDNADHRFHLGNASTAAVFAGKVELRSGDLWVQSLNKNDEYTLTSANASVSYTGGEAILSYDSVKGKTQLMVINGLMKLSNLRAPELNLTVAEGNFSFVDMSFEEGMPRDPTPVGQKTYGQLVAIFSGVAPMDAHSADIFKNNDHMAKVTRGIASVTAPAESHELEKEYKKEVMQMKKPAHAAATHVKAAQTKKTTPAANKLIVKIYGLAGSATSASTEIYDIPSVVKTESTKGSRMPASVPTIDEKINPTTPQYKESDKLIEQLNKL